MSLTGSLNGILVITNKRMPLLLLWSVVLFISAGVIALVGQNAQKQLAGDLYWQINI